MPPVSFNSDAYAAISSFGTRVRFYRARRVRFRQRSDIRDVGCRSAAQYRAYPVGIARACGSDARQRHDADVRPDWRRGLSGYSARGILYADAAYLRPLYRQYAGSLAAPRHSGTALLDRIFGAQPSGIDR